MQPKQLIIFDLNKTLIKETSWYEFNMAMGVTQQEDEVLYKLGPEKEGSITYQEWIGILTKIILKRGKASRQAIEKVILDYHFANGAKEVVNDLQARGFTVAIISGSFNLVVDDVAHKLGVEHAYNNAYLVFDRDEMLEDIVLTWDDLRYKPLLVQSVCRRFGVHPKDVYYVADGDNDAEIFGETIGVAVTHKDDIHEPWKQKALKNGETFARDAATGRAQYHITALNQLLGIVRQP